MDKPNLRIPAEEFGRFLEAYNRGVFPHMRLGQAFLFYYGLFGFGDIKYATDTEYVKNLIVSRFIGRLD